MLRYPPRVLLLITTVLACTAAPTPSRAAGAVRVTAEPGVGRIAISANRHKWGLLGALSVAVELTDLLWLQLHADRKYFPAGRNATNATHATVGGISLVYNIDVLNVTPFVELGWSQVSLDTPWTIPETTQVPVLGIGAEGDICSWASAGFVSRYYPVHDSALLDRPQYVTANARLGLIWR